VHLPSVDVFYSIRQSTNQVNFTLNEWSHWQVQGIRHKGDALPKHYKYRSRFLALGILCDEEGNPMLLRQEINRCLWNY